MLLLWNLIIFGLINLGNRNFNENDSHVMKDV